MMGCLLLPSPVWAAEDTVIYRQAQKAAKQKQEDIAYLRFDEILRKFPLSKYRPEALFAVGEYHCSISNYKQAQELFMNYLKIAADEPSRLFAFAYLYKIAGKLKDDKARQSFKKEIIALNQVSLVFRKYEKFDYTSPLGQKYTAKFHIDKIEFFLDQGGFVEIPL